MRNCQVCDHNGKRVIQNDYDGQNLCLFECTKCGHRYVDALHLSQEWFDNFYLTRYSTNDKELSGARLDSLAECVSYYVTGSINNVADIGGTDGELVGRLRERNVMAWGYGVGEEQNEQWKADGVILSHTLEHIYDVGAMFERIHRFMPSGYLFIEIPVHLRSYQVPQDYDNHWQHVNKFRPLDITMLFVKHGFEIVQSTQIADYWEYNCWRIIGVKL